MTTERKEPKMRRRFTRLLYCFGSMVVYTFDMSWPKTLIVEFTRPSAVAGHIPRLQSTRGGRQRRHTRMCMMR